MKVMDELMIISIAREVSLYMNMNIVDGKISEFRWRFLKFLNREKLSGCKKIISIFIFSQFFSKMKVKLSTKPC